MQRQLLRINLTRGGHEVVERTDGRSAWAFLQEEDVQLVITDWLMPDMDGPELIRNIRAADLPHYVYTVLLTVRDSKDDIVTGLEAGADDYLTKPFNANELMARVSIGVRILNLESKLRESMKQLHQLATFDSLTGVHNRRSIYEHAEAELDRARREQRPISLVMMDADRFKSINDQYGHAVGDQALKHIADTILRNRRPYDWVGRWGGEEFLIVLPGTNDSQSHTVAERICQAIAESRISIASGGELEVGVSLGVTSTGLQPDTTLDDLIQQADEALYQAKRQGGGQVCLYKAGG